MELKSFQSAVLEKLQEYLHILKKEYQDENVLVEHYKQKGEQHNRTDFCRKAWEKWDKKAYLPTFKDKKGVAQKPPYLSIKDGLGNIIPHICLKAPTGGGKTLLGVHAVESINFDYWAKNTGFVLWVVPTEAIYRQTLISFKDKSHPYRMVLERASGGRVKILEKTSSFSLQDVQEHLCVMLLMLQSANRETKESLKVFKDSGKFIDFFPDINNYPANYKLYSKIKNLDFHGSLSQRFGGAPNISIKQSLGNALRIIQPLIVLDEGHRAYSDLSRDTISKLNPRFILELSATPNMKKHVSNVLVSVSGVRLKEEEMIKIPINILNTEKGDWKKTLCQAYEKRLELDNIAQKYFKQSQRFIRPIMLIQVERTGKEQREGKFIHSEDAKEYLVQHLGIHPQAIRIKTSGRNELKDEDLLSDLSPVKYIITNKALQEGWDCPFAYVLAILGKSKSRQALTQLIGRILRQPYAQAIKEFPSLNESYVFCYNRVVREVVEDIRKGLSKEGMDDIVDQVRFSDHSLRKETAHRRKGKNFEQRIFLPRVLFKDQGKWRKLIYESDILQNVDYNKISYSKLKELTPDKIESLKTDVIKVDMEDEYGQLVLPEVKRQTYESSEISLDFLLMTKRLCNFIPNPLTAGRILDEVLFTLKKKGVSDKTIWLNRNFLLSEIEIDIKKQVEECSEQLFTDKLKNREICFKIFKNRIDIKWEMSKGMDFIVSETDKVLRKRDGSDLQLSLFTNTYEKHYNELEKKVAWYLDESHAVRWWHRMVARQDYHLQGWQKQKVWPDFLACVVPTHEGKTYAVLETKGDFLKGNDDTKYKERLFRLLEHYQKEPLDVGDLETVTPEEEKMVFKILMEKSWQTNLQTAIKS